MSARFDSISKEIQMNRAKFANRSAILEVELRKLLDMALPLPKPVPSEAPVAPTKPPAATELPTMPPTSDPVLPKSQWDISGGVDFILEAKFKTTAAGGTIVGKAFANGLWKNGGSAGQGKMVFLRGGKVGMDMGWVGYFACNRIVNDGNWHSVALKYVKAEGEQYQLFVDDMQTPCSKGLKPNPDNPDTSIVEGTAIGHVVNNGVANGDMAPAMDGEVTGVTYKQHPYSSR
jgi:hypothetical protein